VKMTAAETYRRDRLSLWETILMVRAAGGLSEAMAPVVLLIAFVGVAAVSFGALILARDASPADRFFVLAGLLIPISAMSMTLFEVRRIGPLAFLRTIPQPYAPRSLLLVPAAGLGVLIAIASLSVLPVLAAVALLGCWCWAMAIGHRFAGRTGWFLLFVAVPLAYVALLVAAVSFAAGGLTAVAAVSTVFGLAGCLGSPRDRFLALVATGSKRPLDGAPAYGGALDVTVLQGRRSGRPWRAFRIFQMALRANPRGSNSLWWFLLSISATCLLALTVTSPMRALGYSLVYQMTVANALVASNSRAAREFLFTRPIGRWLLLRSAVLPWVLLGLLFPAVALVSATTRTTLAREDLSSLSYPRDAIERARSSAVGQHPPKLSRQVIVSPSLRPLLIDSVLRFSFLQLAWFLSFAAFGITNRRKGWSRIRWTSLVLCLVEGGLMIPTFVPWLRLPWGPPAVWLGGLLAATGGCALLMRLTVPD
jgi:hypothetical protein